MATAQQEQQQQQQQEQQQQQQQQQQHLLTIQVSGLFSWVKEKAQSWAGTRNLRI